MAKNPNKKTTQWSAPMTASMKFFLAGCVAELYLLIVRRYYTHGSMIQMIAWYDLYLKVFAGLGAVLAVIGAALFFQKKAPLRKLSCYFVGFGSFLCLANVLVRWRMSLLSVMTLVVPLVILLVLLWDLYDRECALSLTMLGISLAGLLGMRRAAGTSYGNLMKIFVIVCLAAIVVVAVLVKLRKLGKLLPEKADRLPIYVCAALSVAGLAATFMGTTIAYYTMWLLAFVTFALVVYYTVKQL